MDAGGNEKDIKARCKQIKQLTDFILNRYNLGYTNPIIIMGDTNCYKEEDLFNIEEYLFKPINNT
jgi:exonuclease III